MVGELRYKNKIGFWTSNVSKIYSSVAKLSSISFDSEIKTSAAVPLTGVSQEGN